MPPRISTLGADRTRIVDISGVGNGPHVHGADNEPERATYGQGEVNVTPPANPTDWLLLRGAAGRLVRLKSLIISGLAAANGSVPLLLIRRTAANTGGVTTTITPTPHDTTDGAATAVLSRYTAVPTVLGAGAVLHAGRLVVAASATNLDRLAMQFTWQNDKAPVLRSASEWIAVNLTGAALPAGAALDWDVLWTEE